MDPVFQKIQKLLLLQEINSNGKPGILNSVGLPGPGIDIFAKRIRNSTLWDYGKPLGISIGGDSGEEYLSNIKKIIHALKDKDNYFLELNISCPNTDKHMINDGISKFINNKRRWCILKLSPIEEYKNVDKYYEKGFRQFHCSNTLPTITGGLSGPLLKYYNYILIDYIKNKYPDTEIIAGGGIQTINDIKRVYFALTHCYNC